MAALKVQPQYPGQVPTPRLLEQSWIEANVMRGCNHPNIVGYYSHFVVSSALRYASSSPGARTYQVCILMEYASAGDLHDEVKRFPGQRMPEAAAQYYAHHMASGLRYLHSKYVLHDDLHIGNVLLKYRPNGFKVAIISDFGITQ